MTPEATPEPTAHAYHLEMGGGIATGVPAWPNVAGGFDLSPLLMIIAAILAGRFVFGIGLTGPAIGALVLGGTLCGPWLADATGLLPAAAIGFIALAAGAAWVRRSRPADRPRLFDTRPPYVVIRARPWTGCGRGCYLG